MNKLVVVNDVVKEQILDDSIQLSFVPKNEEFGVNLLRIKVTESTRLEIYYENDKKSKLDIWIDVDEKVHFELIEIRNGVSSKVQYHNFLSKNSSFFSQKLYFVEGMREVSYTFLNGENAQYHSVLKTISTKKEKYDMEIIHNAKHTESNIINHGVNVKDGSIIFNVTGTIPKGMKESTLNQFNRILTFNEEECKISPILLVDEEDVIANHSAYIGKFREEELFYLMSRGIHEKDATMLLTKGFLRSKLHLEEELLEQYEKKLDTVWR